jgi:hypothetical protein
VVAQRSRRQANLFFQLEEMIPKLFADGRAKDLAQETNICTQLTIFDSWIPRWRRHDGGGIRSVIECALWDVLRLIHHMIIAATRVSPLADCAAKWDYHA